MSTQQCPEPEILLAALLEEHPDSQSEVVLHSKSCEHCARLIEEHRQLEKDLFRLADPLPPVNFVNNVMAKVAISRTPAKSEALIGGVILVAALALCAVTFVLGSGSLGALGIGVASATVQIKQLLVATDSGLSALWYNAAVPLTATLGAILLVSLFGLRRLAGLSLAGSDVLP